MMRRQLWTFFILVQAIYLGSGYRYRIISRTANNNFFHSKPQKISAELRILIQGTKNAYTTARTGDILSYRLPSPIDGCTLRLGALSEEGALLPLCTRQDGSNIFDVDISEPPVSAESLKQENRLYRIISSDRKGESWIIDEFLGSEYLVPIISKEEENVILKKRDGERNKKAPLETAQVSTIHGQTINTGASGITSEIRQLELELQVSKLQQRLIELQLEQAKKTVLQAVESANAPAAIGPYSQAVKANGLLFVSGCIGMDPVSKNLVPGGIEAEAQQALANLRSIVCAAGASIENIAKVTIYTTDLKQYSLVNQLYAKFLTGNKVFPARTTVEVSALPLGSLIEVDAIIKL